jgi:hypothetical protein
MVPTQAARSVGWRKRETGLFLGGGYTPTSINGHSRLFPANCVAMAVLDEPPAKNDPYMVQDCIISKALLKLNKSLIN